MSNDNLPKLPPPVMHGMGKMLEQARNVKTPTANAVSYLALRVKLDALKKKIQDISILNAAFRAQCSKLPEDHEMRLDIEKMLTIR